MQKRLQSLFQIAGAMLLILGLSSGSAEARQIDLYASGFSLPMGLEVDADGRVWVADQGAVGEDGSIQVIDLDQSVHPFLTGLRAEPIFGNNEAAQHLRFLNGDLYMTQGLTSDVPEGYLLRISTAGFTPGDMPRSPADLDMVRDVGTFVINEGHAETNAYNLAFGPDDDVFIADASANALLRWRRALDELEIVAEFPPIPNPTGFGPPFSDAVPTGIVYKDGGFYVSVFSGFPFVSGNSRIYRVLPDGTMSIYRDGLTSIVDLAIDPRDEKLVALSFGSATMGDFNPGTGAILKFHDGWHNVLADGLVFPAGLAFADDGTLYFSSLTGNVYRLETNIFQANLAGFNEPAPNPFGTQDEGFFPLTVDTPASGWFRVELDGNDFIMTGEFSGLKAPFTGSHIHTGVAGVNGPVVVPLTPTLDADNRGGTFDQTATVSDDLVAALLAGGLYFNVHSTDHPPGEIRGQLLMYPNEPPAQAEPELGPGFAFDFVNAGDPEEMAVVIVWDEVQDPDGDRVIYQFEAAADADFNTIINGNLTVLNGVVHTQLAVPRAVIDAILEMLGVAVGDSFTFYTRINSTDGSLRTVGETMVFNITRGVLGPPEPMAFEANLAGYNEPAPNPFGSPEDGFFPLTVVTPATGWFEVELDGNDFIMTGEFSGLKAPFTGSHIHRAVAGVNGPVVVPLTPTLDADEMGGTFDQTATVSDELVEALLAGELYFNVHSTAHPPGEIRGQLLLQPNSPPEQVEAELASGFAFDFTNEGDPSDPALQLFWDAVTDPDGDRVIYQVEAAADPDFDMLVMGILTVLEGVVYTEINIDRGSLDAVLEQLGVAVGGVFTFYVRVNSSDGSLRTVGETMIFNVTRGILRDPDDDVTAPSCRLIAMLPGPPAALHVEVQDEESGLAAVEVVFANNVDIDIPTFDAGTNDVLTIIATKIDNAMRASFAIRATDVAGNETVCDPVVATLIAEIPEHFELKQNYPNPFNPSTSFELLLPESGHVSLAVYDLGGRRVATLVEQHMDAGTYRFDWDGMTDGGVALASGVYIYRVIAGANVSTRTMTLIR